MKSRSSDPLVFRLYALVVYLVFCVAYAQAENAATIPRFSSLLVDQTELLGAAENAAIEARLKMVQASGRAQIGVLIATGTGEEPGAIFVARG